MMSQPEVWLLIFKHVGTFYVVTLFASNSNTEHASIQLALELSRT